MSTKDLVKTCLTYPCWILITSRDNNQTGYDYIRSIFNGFRELEKRSDACNELLKVYQTMNPEEITSNKKLIEQGVSNFQFIFIELLISQRSILKRSTKDDIITAIKTSLSVFEKKSKKKNKYSLFSLSTTSLILARILEQSNTKIYETLLYQNPVLIEFVEKAFVPSKDLLDQIAISSLEYLNQLEL